jgi:sulfate transport system permease protein
MASLDSRMNSSSDKVPGEKKRVGSDSLPFEPPIIRNLLIGITVAFVAVFLVLPVAVIFQQAFSKGMQGYLLALRDPDAVAAIRLTLVAAAGAVTLNTAFGLCAAYAITHFSFPGKSLLLSLIDLPFLISPVVSGLLLVLLFGSQGLLGPLVNALNITIVFAPWGIILATTFVTFPFVARELIPVMEMAGKHAEEAAMVLGARPLTMFFRVTLPSIKWGLWYGVVLCLARAMGEFGAVSVVSGHIRGVTNTIPLHVEILYNEYNFAGSFSVASVLLLLSMVSLILKLYLERKVPAQGRSIR